MATAADVKAVSLTGEFDGYTDDQIAVFLADAATFLDKTTWGDRYERAHALLTAHMILDVARSATGGLPAAVTWESIGGASRSYAAPGQSNTGPFANLRLHATPYGRRVAAMMDALPLSPLVVWDATVPPDRWDY